MGFLNFKDELKKAQDEGAEILSQQTSQEAEKLLEKVIAFGKQNPKATRMPLGAKEPSPQLKEHLESQGFTIYDGWDGTLDDGYPVYELVFPEK